MRLRCCGRTDAGTGVGNSVSVRSYPGDDTITEYTRRYLGDSTADAGSTPAASTMLGSQRSEERSMPCEAIAKRGSHVLRYTSELRMASQPSVTS